MRSFDARSVKSAITMFDRALELAPRYGPAYAAKAEATLRYFSLVRIEGTWSHEIEPVMASVQEALKATPDSWHAHIVLGAVYAANWDWSGAQASFDKALKQDPIQTREHPWYAGFLLAIQRCDEALHLVREMAIQRPEDFNAQMVYAMFLYATRQFKDARAAISKAILLREESWSIPFLSGLIDFAMDDYSEASFNFHDADSRLSYDSFRLQGFRVLTEARMVDTLEGALSTLSELTRDPSASRLHLAFAHLGFHHCQESIEALETLSGTGEPLMAWLHLWPVFDELRGYEQFNALLGKMRIPTG